MMGTCSGPGALENKPRCNPSCCCRYTGTAEKTAKLLPFCSAKRGSDSGPKGGFCTNNNVYTKTEKNKFYEHALWRRLSVSCQASATSFPRQRTPLATHLLLFLLVPLVPINQTSEPQETCKDRDLFFPRDGATAMNFGVSFASAALCARNNCLNGTCYENGGLQICVCDKPYWGPLCENTFSLCNGNCGIKVSTGIDCSSALCSLGTCVDTPTEPFFRCECGDFFVGDNCETHSNPCTSSAANPCGQGRCNFAPGKGSGTVTCQCNEDYETPEGAGMTIVKWGNSEVLQGPSCTVRKNRGIAKLHVSLTSGQIVVWWAVFATATLLLIWCCYTVIREGGCGRWALAFKAAPVARALT